MKLTVKTLVAMAMVIGAFSAMGCNKVDGAVAPEENADSAQVVEQEEGTPGIENALRFGAYYAPRQPPAARYENPGRAPSSRHFWANGYWRWSGRDHVWVAGRWYPQRDRYTYVGPRWENRYGRWQYVPSYWVRRR